jgi:two-component system NtrC family sensor kinase
MTKLDAEENRRILVIDDNQAIHDDFRKILMGDASRSGTLDETKAAVFGEASATAEASTISFEVDSAYQGQEGLERVRQAVQAGRPYAVAFVDMRMPPGWNGLDTASRLWQEDPDLQIVICTAYSDYSWEEMARELSQAERWLILKKPFDVCEIRQLASTLAEKRRLAHTVQLALNDLERMVEVRTRELVHTSKNLHEAHAGTKQLLESIPLLLIALDADDRVTSWNSSAERALGIVTTDAVGQSLADLEIEWDHGAVARAITECRAKNRLTRVDELRFKPTGRTGGFLSIAVNPLSTDRSRCANVLLVAADITEQRILEGQLAQAQKLESIGRLAAGIAHEINTPTQFVGDNARFLQDAFGDLQGLLTKCTQLTEACRANSVTPELLADVEAAAKGADLAYLNEQIPQAITQTLEGVERVADIVRAMKNFSHPGGEGMEAVDLNKAIESTITVARNEWKYVAEIVTHFDPALPPVPCLAGDFNQVILNIVINATHAIAGVVGDGAAGKGTITVSTHHDGDWAEIHIRDTGTGIPEEHRSKVFDHFFTTKEVGKGTGQGLAIAHAVVVEKHGGTITFETEMGRGTTFIIRLPIEHERAASKETAHHEEAHSLR